MGVPAGLGALVTAGRASEQRGTVTAEAAVCLPIVAAFALVLVWLISVGIAQVETVDAARDAARSLARGDDRQVAVDLARRTAPAGARVSVRDTGTTVAVTVSVRDSPPKWVLVPLPAIDVGSTSVVAVEGPR